MREIQKKRGMERKKPYRTQARGRCASPGWPREREDFPIIYVFSPPRFFALQQIKRNPHPWGTLLDYSLFSSRFHGSPFAFHPARACARVCLADCISILRSIRCPLSKKKFFFFINTREILRRDAWIVTDIQLAML